MPELPEIFYISNQLNEVVVGCKVKDVVIHQEKCINKDLDTYKKDVIGKTITSVTSLGKWVICYLDDGSRLLFNMGMGGDLLYSKKLPERKYQGHFELDCGYYLTFRFWWFGHIHHVFKDELHKETDKLGKDPFRSVLTKAEFVEHLQSRKGNLRTYLLSQKYVTGIGNSYIHDILFKAKINPFLKGYEVSKKKLEILYDVMIDEFKTSIAKGGAFYEVDIYNQHGTFQISEVGYKENEPCPVCGTLITKEKVGSLTAYYCKKCQK
jgi:formamidopyrimidine-DNA glycosylase